MKFSRNKSLKTCSTFCIGGKAEYFFESGSIREILEAIAKAEEKKIPWRVFGGGSNILFPEKKIKGLLIRFSGGHIQKDKETVTVSAGVPLSRLVSFSVEHGLKGLEALSGIPGGVGGAVYGNAGAYGQSVSDCLERVEIFNGRVRQWIPKSACGFGYRESVFSAKGGSASGGKGRWVILQALFLLEKGKQSELKEASKHIIRERLKKYPPTLRCPGSFFKNPLVAGVSKSALKMINRRKVIDGKIPAGYLLEEVGARGMRAGGIRVAHYHGNLFINMGNGTVKDVKKLARILRKRVKRKFGVILEEEVQVWKI